MKRSAQLCVAFIFLLVVSIPGILFAAIPPDLKGQLFFASSPSGSGWDFSIWAIDLDRAQARKVVDLTGRLYWINELDISPDGKKIVITSISTGGGADFEIWLVNTDGTNLFRLTNFPAPFGALYGRWSRTGANAVYYLHKKETTEPFDHVERYDLDTGTVTEYFPGPGHWTKGMDISRDDQSAVMIRELSCCNAKNTFVASQPLDGSAQTMLRNSNGFSDACPRVNLEDGWIVYWEETAVSPDYADLFVMDPFGNQRIAVTGDPQLNPVYGCPVWAGGDHNSYVVFSTSYFGGRELIAMHPNPGEWPNSVVRFGQLVGGMQIAPVWTRNSHIATFPTELAGGTSGGLYSATLTASGGIAPYSFSKISGTLPPGLSLGSNGKLSGTLSSTGTYTFEVQVTDSNTQKPSHGWRTYTIDVSTKVANLGVTCPNINILPSTLPNGTAGVNYNVDLDASFGVDHYSFSVSSGHLPPGLEIDPSTGILAGTPTVSGEFHFTIAATDANVCTGKREYTLKIGCGSITLGQFIPSNNGVVHSPYSGSITASGGNSPYSFKLESGILPQGLSLSNDGTLSGVPISASTFGFVVSATDTGGCKGTIVYSLNINESSCAGNNIVISPATNPPPANAHVTYNWMFTASGGSPPYSFNIQNGILPQGLSLSKDGYITGIPVAIGDYPFILVATDDNGCRGSTAYNVPVIYTPFSNYFADNVIDNSWNYTGTWKEMNGTGAASSGSLQGSSTTTQAEALAAGFAGCSDCSIETKIQWNGQAGSSASILGWYTDANHYVELKLNRGSTDEVSLTQIWNGEAYRVKKPRPILPSTRVAMMLDAAGSFQVYLDGSSVPFLTMPATGTPFGTIGFRVKGTTVDFDEIVVKANLAAIIFDLKVTKSGSGCGKITSSLPGIQCGTDCVEGYPASTIVKLNPTIATGSAWGGWTGAPDCNDGTLAMSSSKTCIATFTGGLTSQVLQNPGFESNTSAWTISPASLREAHSSSWPARNGGWKLRGRTNGAVANQQVTIPSTACRATLKFYLQVKTTETSSTLAMDKLKVEVLSSTGVLLKTLATYSNLDKSSSYILRTFDLSTFIGKTIRLRFTSVQNSTLVTNFMLDDVSFFVTK